MATFNTAFGSLPGTNDALGTNNNSSGPKPPQPAQPAQPQTPQQAQQGQSGQAQPAPVQTFAQMQKAGVARPAPAPSAGTAAPPFQITGTTGADLRQSLLEQINRMMSGQVDPSFEAQAAVKRQDLASDFKTAQQRLQEQLAARGLFASTIGADQMGDLSGSQARALAALEADVMRQQQEALARDRQVGFTGLSELTKLTSDIEMRALQLQQEAALQGRSLDLQSARDQVAKDLGFSELALKREQLQSDQAMERARLEETRALRLQNLGISNRELDQAAQRLQQEAALEGRRLDLQQARDLAEVDYRARQLQMEDKRLTYEQARDKARNELDRELANDRNAITREGMAQDREAANLDRQLRERLGLGQLEIDRLRASQEGRAFLVQLAQLIGVDKLTPEQLSSLGIGGSGAGSGTGTGVSTGGGSGVGGGGGAPPTDTFF